MQVNTQQQAVVAHPRTGVAVVLALAGTGKTTTLRARAKALLADDPTAGILIITFAKRIQQEFNSKVITDPQLNGRVKVSTAHSLALQLVGDHLALLPQVHAPAIVVESVDYKLEQLAEENVLKPMRIPCDKGELRILAKTLIALGDLERAVSREDFFRLTKKYGDVIQLMADYGITDYMAVARKIYEDRYDKGVLAFSDMLPLAVTLPDRCFANLMVGGLKVSYVMVDEAQDLNQVQHQLVSKLHQAMTGMTLVGDIHQAIFGFTGAMPHVFAAAPQTYGATVYPLETNYRCSQAIIDFANTLLIDFLQSDLLLNCGRPDLIEYPEPWILPHGLKASDWINQLVARGVDHKDMAILYRLNKQALGLELELISRKIPYQAKTSGFLSLPVVRDLLSYLMMLIAPSDEWWTQLMQTRKYLGKDTAMASWGQTLFDDEKRPWMTNPDTLRNRGMQQAWAALASHMEILKDELVIMGGPPGPMLERLRTALIAHWRHKYADDPLSYEDALSVSDAVVAWVHTMGSVHELGEVFANRKQLTTTTGVRLMTIHGAKGLEFDAVLLYELGPETFVRSFQEDEPEEYRLAYVGTTRGRKYVTLHADPKNPDGGVLCRHLRRVLRIDEDPMDFRVDAKYAPW